MNVVKKERTLRPFCGDATCGATRSREEVTTKQIGTPVLGRPDHKFLAAVPVEGVRDPAVRNLRKSETIADLVGPEALEA